MESTLSWDRGGGLYRLCVESTEWGVQSSRTSLRKTLLGIDVAIVLSQDTAILEVGVKEVELFTVSGGRRSSTLKVANLQGVCWHPLGLFGKVC